MPAFVQADIFIFVFMGTLRRMCGQLLHVPTLRELKIM